MAETVNAPTPHAALLTTQHSLTSRKRVTNSINHQLSTINSQPSTLNHQLSTINHQLTYQTIAEAGNERFQIFSPGAHTIEARGL